MHARFPIFQHNTVVRAIIIITYSVYIVIGKYEYRKTRPRRRWDQIPTRVYTPTRARRIIAEKQNVIINTNFKYVVFFFPPFCLHSVLRENSKIYNFKPLKLGAVLVTGTPCVFAGAALSLENVIQTCLARRWWYR